MKPKINRVGIIKHQYEFLLSNATNTALVAGYGSGKTFAAAFKAVYVHWTEETPVAYFMPTNARIIDTAFKQIANIFNILKIGYRLNRNQKVFYTDKGEILMRSMDDIKSIISYNVGYSIVDEADVLPKKKMEEVFVNILGRTRLNNTKNRVDFVSTPEGYNFLYDFFVKKGDEGDKRLIKAKTTDNPFAKKDFIENLYSLYGKEHVKAYVNGEFVNLTNGSVYNSYERGKHESQEVVMDNEPLYIGVDFNITNMSAVVLVNRGIAFHAVDEITGGYDTNDLCQKIRNKYLYNPIHIYPDASCRARKTSGFSDYDIIRNYFSSVRSPESNPSVRQRINLVNGLFCNYHNESALFVNTSKCKNLTTALETLSYDKKGDPDKKSGYDHVVDALGYPMFQIMRRSGQNTVVANY